MGRRKGIIHGLVVEFKLSCICYLCNMCIVDAGGPVRSCISSCGSCEGTHSIFHVYYVLIITTILDFFPCVIIMESHSVDYVDCKYHLFYNVG